MERDGRFPKGLGKELDRSGMGIAIREKGESRII